MVKKIIGQCYIWLLLILMYLPVLILIAFSFTDTERVGEWSGFSFDLYPRLFQSEEIMTALGNTLLIALVSSLLATLIGSLGAVGAFYSKKKVKHIVDLGTQIPVVNAEIVVAFSLTVMFVFIGNLINVYMFSFWTLLIGHMCLSIPFVYISVKPKLQQMDPNLYEAALDLGCSPSRALGKVIIPEIMPGVLSGFLLAVTLSLDDFVVTAFTRGPGLLSGEKKIETLSTYIQAKIKRTAVPPEMRALTTIIFIVVVLAVVGVSVHRHYKTKKESQNMRRA